MMDRHFILELDEFPLHPTQAPSAETIEPETQECRMVDRADSVVPIRNGNASAARDVEPPKVLDA